MNNEVIGFEPIFVTRLIESQDLKPVIKARLTADHLFLPETKNALTFIFDHYNRYNVVPSLELFKAEFPTFPFQTTSDPVEALVEEIQSQALYRDLAAQLDEVIRQSREDPRKALDTLQGSVARMTAQFGTTTDIDATQSLADARAEYQRVKAGHGRLGIAWPWPRLSEATLGIQRQELIVFYARPKSLKSWLMIVAAQHAHSLGFKVLFITFEMPTAQIRRRLHAVFTSMDYARLRKGALTPAEEKRYFEDLEAFSEMPPFIISGCDEADAKDGVIGLKAKIKEYDPDIIFVDGIYLMRDDRAQRNNADHEMIRHIVVDLKRMALTLNIPVVGSSQANRDAEKLKGKSTREVAFSDAIVQNADYLIRILTDETSKANREAVLKTPAIREDEGCTFTINTFVAQDFSQKAVLADNYGEDDGSHDQREFPAKGFVR